MGGWTGSNDDESIAALERSLELGCTFFDTALAYGNGRSEKLLGRVLARHRGERPIVATKIPPKNLRWPALPDYALDDVYHDSYNYWNVTLSATLAPFELQLAYLGVDDRAADHFDEDAVGDRVALTALWRFSNQ